MSTKEDLVNWQKYQAGIQEIKPWIERSESKFSLITEKPSSLHEGSPKDIVNLINSCVLIVLINITLSIFSYTAPATSQTIFKSM